MGVLIVESNREIAQALQVAIERARPGLPVMLCADATEAARAIEAAKRAGSPLPRLAVLGPQAAAQAHPAQLDALRQAAGTDFPIVAFSVGGQAPAQLRLDEVYEQPFEWQALGRRMAQVLDKWLN